MKKVLHHVLPILMIVGLMTGCGADTDTSNLQEPTTKDALVNEENGQIKDADLQKSGFDKDKAETIDPTNASGEDILYTYKEITVTFPA